MNYQTVKASELQIGDTILPWNGEVEITGTWTVTGAFNSVPLTDRIQVPTDSGVFRYRRDDEVRIEPRASGDTIASPAPVAEDAVVTGVDPRDLKPGQWVWLGNVEETAAQVAATPTVGAPYYCPMAEAQRVEVTVPLVGCNAKVYETHPTHHMDGVDVVRVSDLVRA